MASNLFLCVLIKTIEIKIWETLNWNVSSLYLHIAESVFEFLEKWRHVCQYWFDGFMFSETKTEKSSFYWTWEDSANYAGKLCQSCTCQFTMMADKGILHSVECILHSVECMPLIPHHRAVTSKQHHNWPKYLVHIASTNARYELLLQIST